jgi:predicted GH43/DUF377 family glycosyl hydrolase
MLKKIQNAFISQLNKYPILKNKLVHVIDFLFEFRKVAVGNVMRNPPYIKHVLKSKIIAKPGTLSFGALFNPGALVVDDHILLLANAQKIPWFKTRGKNRKFYLEGQPVQFLLDKKSLNTVQEEIITNITGFPSENNWAIEDMRLFTWKGQKMINHSFITKGKVGEFVNQTSVASAVSILDEKEKKFSFHAFPKLDFPVQNIEKNWVYRETDNKLILFYSVNPYKVLILEDEKQFKFRSIINQDFYWQLKNPGGFGTMVSFSTNPIEFDELHWLIIVHQIKNRISGRCYYHWAVLIDKSTFLPVKITSKPIFSGMGARGRTPGIRYISSILKVNNEILFFAGEGDVYVTVTKKTIPEINANLISL